MQASKCETRKTREQETKETKSEESDRNEFSKQIEARSQGGAVAIRVSAVGSGPLGIRLGRMSFLDHIFDFKYS
ncbi:hypothetical protein An18g02420 [Aspergillus niger]|uniref:Uncharacterized protein n=2 Tax=Aspergillus niger TaxID=5061 RepID=A2RAA0_ASPNC|nr:hypothetical protein An18g02420 [Aspergillus niger]CAK43172.1 hypothetical protein An18g02420 [Aspergillus niger]